MFNSEDLAQTTTAETRRLPSPERSVTVTSLDMRQAKFGTVMRGFDKNEVSAFLQEAAEGYDQALRENERLRQEVARLEGALSQFRDLEGSLKNTLVSAQKLADDLKENATQEAARIVRDAEARAELIVDRGRMRLDELQRDIDALKMKRRDAEVEIEATIAALQHTLDLMHQPSEKDKPEERRDKVVVHVAPLAASH